MNEEQPIASTSNLINKEDYLILEQSILKAPIEELKRIQKITQKTFEYNLNSQSSFIKELNQLIIINKEEEEDDKNNKNNKEIEKLNLNNSIELMLNKIKLLKKKLIDLDSNSNKTIKIIKSRLNYLNFNNFNKNNLNLKLIDYFLRLKKPLINSSLNLIKIEKIEDLIDFSLFNELIKVEKCLKSLSLNEALIWSSENRSNLKKLKSPLEFTLHLQVYIELCRSRSLNEAIIYARKFLSPMATSTTTTTTTTSDNTSQLEELNQAMALLAFSPDTVCSPYRELYSKERWNSLATLFRSTFLSLHSLPSIPLLHLSLQAGLASLKTPICCPRLTTTSETTTNSSTTTTTTNSNHKTCPICFSPLKELANEVPYSHHLNSTVVCAISGEVIEGGGGEGGQLVALVSKNTGEGRVYSREALELRIANDPMKRLTDPETGEIFSWQEVQKVFIS